MRMHGKQKPPLRQPGRLMQISIFRSLKTCNYVQTTLFLASLLLTGLSLQGQTVQQTTFNVDSLF
jgi:hypothetical protein